VGAAFLIALLLVTLAELGDKTQLLVLALAARYRPTHVIVGVAIAVLLLQLIAVLLGTVAGSLLPEKAVAIVAGLLFIGFGVWTWRDASGDEEDEQIAERGRGLGPVLTVAAAFFVAELGDKTQLMTVSIAADPSAALRTLEQVIPGLQPPAAGTAGTMIGVWLGSTLGMLLADGVALLIGFLLGARLPERLIRRMAAVVFVLFGVVTLVSAFV
jgi:putative Ca2+/H+ antiporter (TMEM165/GDT1 family)